jgi:hypothetical protein
LRLFRRHDRRQILILLRQPRFPPRIEVIEESGIRRLDQPIRPQLHLHRSLRRNVELRVRHRPAVEKVQRLLVRLECGESHGRYYRPPRNIWTAWASLICPARNAARTASGVESAGAGAFVPAMAGIGVAAGVAIGVGIGVGEVTGAPPPKN